MQNLRPIFIRINYDLSRGMKIMAENTCAFLQQQQQNQQRFVHAFVRFFVRSFIRNEWLLHILKKRKLERMLSIVGWCSLLRRFSNSFSQVRFYSVKWYHTQNNCDCQEVDKFYLIFSVVHSTSGVAPANECTAHTFTQTIFHTCVSFHSINT